MSDRLSFFAAASALLLLVAGCRNEAPPSQPTEDQSEPSPMQQVERPVSLPVPVPPADREALLLAVVRAASAQALGRNDSQAQRELAGQRFTFRMRFGCAGPGGQGFNRWEYETDGGTLRAEVEIADRPLFPAMAPEEGSEVEGLSAFLVDRPWLLAAACPAGQPAPAIAIPGGQVALVEYHAEGESRVSRPPGTYRAVKDWPEERVPAEGLELVLSGRLEARKDGRVIRCASSAPGLRPDCAVAAGIESARIEDPRDATLVAEWNRR